MVPSFLEALGPQEIRKKSSARKDTGSQEVKMRDLCGFVPGQIYGVTERGNNGQWVFEDEEDFLKALSLMDCNSEIHEVKVHGYYLMHNHGHWMFEASTEESTLPAEGLH